MNRPISDTSVGAMGKTSDPNAVVDTEGNVIGAKSLRVVDASVFPLLPPGHLLSTVCKRPVGSFESIYAAC